MLIVIASGRKPAMYLCEDIVPALLKKAADVSTAGRENFLTQYADAALSQMVLSCAEAPTAKALLSMCVILVS